MTAEKLHRAYLTVARQRHTKKKGSVAMEINAVIEEVLEAVFSAWSTSSH
jgi:hypothetical protein